MRNIEELRSYFLGKDPQLKETMSDNSLRLCGIEGKHYVLRTELLNRLEELRKHVDDKDEELQGAIDRVVSDLSGETLARINADNRLDTKISGEILNRQHEDQRIEGLISAEEAARILADNNLLAKFNDYYTKTQVDNKINDAVVMTKLTQDITIYEDNPTIAGLSGTGWYFTGEHVVNYGDGEDTSILAHKNTIFYYWENPDYQNDNFLWFLPTTLEDGVWVIHLMLYFDIDNNEWVYSGYDITEQVNDNANDLQVPTAGAVYTALQNNGGGFKTLDTQQVIKVYELDTGTYYLPDPGVGYSTTFNYNSAHNRSLFGNAWLFVDKNDSGYTSWFMIQGDAGFPMLTSGYCTTTTGTNGYIFDINANRLEDSGHRVTSMSNASTDIQYPSAKAVWDLISERGITPVSGDIRIWTADPGIYRLEANTTIYYNGETDTTNYINCIYPAYLIVMGDSSNKEFFLFWFNGGSELITTGHTDATIGITSTGKRIDLMEQTSNKVTSISSSSTNTEYPTAKLLYDLLALKQTKLATDLTADLYLVDGTKPSLTNGFYFTNGYGVYINGTKDGLFDNSIFYYVDLGSDCMLFYSFGDYPYYHTAKYNSPAWTTETRDFPTIFTGTDGNTNGTSGTVPAPTTTDVGKFLCADGTWQTAGGGLTSITQDTNIWQLTAGTYSIGLNNQNYFDLYYDPSDNTKKIQINNASILVVDINTNSDTVYFSLYEGTEQIVSGEIDPNGVFSPVIDNVNLHISTISTADIDFLFA